MLFLSIKSSAVLCSVSSFCFMMGTSRHGVQGIYGSDPLPPLTHLGSLSDKLLTALYLRFVICKMELGLIFRLKLFSILVEVVHENTV